MDFNGEKKIRIYTILKEKYSFTIYSMREVACIFGQFFYEHMIWLHNCYTGKIVLINSRITGAPCFRQGKNFVKGSSVAWLQNSSIKRKCVTVFS